MNTHLVSIYRAPRPALEEFGSNWRDVDTEKCGCHSGPRKGREGFPEEAGFRWPVSFTEWGAREKEKPALHQFRDWTDPCSGLLTHPKASPAPCGLTKYQRPTWDSKVHRPPLHAPLSEGSQPSPGEAGFVEWWACGRSHTIWAFLVPEQAQGGKRGQVRWFPDLLLPQ